MTERDYAIRSFKEVTLNAAGHTEERMDVSLIVTSHNRIELKFIFLLYAEAITLVTA